ncbi:3'-5' exoribonuclease HELZ2-like [Babylonia areolata]|uniref:3'-5' exoribonuclease HELZ2-like n=1 Tax=Babylonia areolata TaxID=304850 RepID=UPI003FD2AF97
MIAFVTKILSRLITGVLAILQQGLRAWWYAKDDEDVAASQPPIHTEDQTISRGKQRDPGQKKKKKKKKRGTKGVNKKGETPCFPPEDNGPRSPSSQSRVSTQGTQGASSVRDRPLTTHSHSRSVTDRTSSSATKHLFQNSVPGTRRGNASPTEGAHNVRENTEPQDDDDCFEDSDDDDDCIQGNGNNFEDNLASAAEASDKEQLRTWFEMSQEVSANKSGIVDDSVVIKLSKEVVEKFKREDKKTKVYPDFEENPEKLLMSDRTKYKRCQIKIESPNRSVAKVLDTCSKFSEIVIDGRSKAGRTYMDDHVVVEILSEPGKNKHTNRRNTKSCHSRTQATQSMEEKAYGRVVGLLKRVNFTSIDNPVIYCKLDRSNGVLMWPLCKTVPKIHVMNDFVEKHHPHMTKTRIEIKEITLDGKLQHKEVFDVHHDKREQYVFKVVLLGWKASCHYPLGAVLDVDMYDSRYNSQLEILRRQQHVPKLFPPDVVDETNSMSEVTVSAQRGGREDLTGETVFTIDNPNTRDLDDAISLKKEGSHYIVGVHISDVAAVIKKDSSIDREARKRAVTRYPLYCQPHPMLPEPLSHDLCSLVPGKERLTLSVFFGFDERGNQTEQQPVIKKSVIKSRQQLTYENVQQVIDGDSPAGIDPSLQDDICTLHRIATTLRKDRKKESTMFMCFTDPRLPDIGNVTEDREAHALIEEFMILTNSCVASKLSKNKRLRDIFLVRSQRAPTPDQLLEWRNREGEITNLVMQLQGKRVSAESHITFRSTPRPRSKIVIQKSVCEKLDRHLEQGEIEEARKLAYTDDLHPSQFLASKHWMDLMETAEYKCCHGLNEPEKLHFDLDRKVYTNCTSPIRRYADLYVQQVLHAYLDEGDVGYTSEDVTKLCQEINIAVLKQKAFHSGCNHLVLAESLQGQPLVFRAYVEKVDNERVTVCIPSLCQTPDWKQELPLSMLGISSQPELSTDALTVCWEKRMYENTITRQQTGGRNSSPTFRPLQLYVYVEYQQWCSILTALSSTDQHTETEKTTQSGSDDFSTSSEHVVQFRRTYKPGQVLQIQMSAKARSGTLKLGVDTLHVARNVELCIQHVREPIPTLCRRAKHETRNQDYSSCKNYTRACAKYLKLWFPVIEMEAALRAGHNACSVVIGNVVVTMTENTSRRNVLYHGCFSLCAKTCNDCDIELGGKLADSFTQKELKRGRKFSLDFLCLRYKSECSETVLSRMKQSAMSVAVDKHYTWLGHASVVSVVNKKRKDADDGFLEVTFDLSPDSPKPPDQLLKKDGALLTIEILPKSDVDRRTQEILCQLKDADHELPRAIAMGFAIPPLDADHEKAGRKLRTTDMEVTGSDGTRTLPQNNPGQREAIHEALTSSLTLIHGPPGTGKTNTGIKLVYHFCAINRQLEAEGKGKKTVMYCGPSNKSVDLVARELRAKLGSKCPKIVRVYGSMIETQDFPVPGMDHRASPYTRGQQCQPDLQDISLHHLIRQRDKPHAEELREFDAKFRRCIERPGMYGIHVQDLKEYRKILYEATKKELQQYDCILTTCAVATSPKVVDDKTSVFQILIDECGMCTEPETMAPILTTKAKQVVLIGDHRQLKPIVLCQEAAEIGLDQSLFERLHQNFPEASILLTDQYRMHPEICAFPSNEFYEGNLKTKSPGRMSLAHTWNVDPLPFWPRRFPQLQFSDSQYERELEAASQALPHLLVDVRGTENMLTVTTEEGNERSRSNAMEADKVIEILAYLKTAHGVDLQTVKVLTQYKAQRHLLEEKLKQACMGSRYKVFERGDDKRLLHETQLISTVVSSQGDEWNYVILSTVRSLPPHKIEAKPTYGWCRQNLGFITDRNQINVALTRARRGLFIVGNKDLLTCDEVWRRLVKGYEEQGCICKAEKFPPR